MRGRGLGVVLGTSVLLHFLVPYPSQKLYIFCLDAQLCCRAKNFLRGYDSDIEPFVGCVFCFFFYRRSSK